jgi:hypothetical protein
MPTYADLSGWVISIIAGRFEVIADTMGPVMTYGKNGKSGPDMAGLRARAIGVRVKYLLGRLEVEENPAIAKSLQWMLERTKSYQNQFAPPAREVQLHTEQPCIVCSGARRDQAHTGRNR